jgi:BASS family bile acid:Na+ symporter
VNPPVKARSARIARWVAATAALAFVTGITVDAARNLTGPALIVALGALAVGVGDRPLLHRFGFTIWVFTFVAASMWYPVAFGTWFGLDLKFLIVPLIQIITFGMGTTLSAADFRRVLTSPWPVFIGIVLQFSVMPIAGYLIATGFRFEPEIAAGVILIGSVSGGVASNLMVYLARGNVALSVTMTACSTLISPLMTPFLMKVLAGRLIRIDFWAMMLEICGMIIVPILAGLVAHQILYRREPWCERPGPLGVMGIACLLLALASLWFRLQASTAMAGLANGLLVGFALMGAVVLTKLIVNIWLRRPGDWMDRVLPLVSMAGICLIIAVITSRSRNELMSVGIVLVGAAILHNLTGYALGYGVARACRLDERTCRTVAFEVGMQNGGMASALAMKVLQSTNAALAPAIFGPWMNVSGSILASWWHRRENGRLPKAHHEH